MIFISFRLKYTQTVYRIQTMNPIPKITTPNINKETKFSTFFIIFVTTIITALCTYYAPFLSKNLNIVYALLSGLVSYQVSNKLGLWLNYNPKKETPSRRLIYLCCAYTTKLISFTMFTYFFMKTHPNMAIQYIAGTLIGITYFWLSNSLRAT